MGFKPRRIRRTAEEARELILDAAEAQLGREGPDSLRLMSLAEALGISHPTILHHFGSREGLVRAVCDRAARRIEAQVLISLQGNLDSTNAVAILERVFRTLDEGGHARMLAWLYLTGHGKDVGYDARIHELATAVHAVRRARHPGADPEDTFFTVLLAGLALFGSAIIGGDDDDLNARFHGWLAGLLRAHLDR